MSFKKLSAAAALAFMATISSAAYASSIGSAIDGAISGAEDIADGVVNAGEDVADGIIGTDGNPAGSGSDNGTTSYSNNDGTNGTAGNGSGSGSAIQPKDGGNDAADISTTSDTNGSAVNSANGTGNPNTGVSLGFVASAAVLAAMGVTLTTVRRKDG